MVRGSKKKDTNLCYLQEIHFKYKGIYRLNVSGWRKIYHVNTIEMNLVQLLICDTADVGAGKVITDKMERVVILG